MVTGKVSFVFSRCSIDIEIELNQDSVNLSQIRFELCAFIFPGKQEVEGGAAMLAEKEREIKSFSISGVGGPCINKKKSSCIDWGGSVSLPHPRS